MTTDIDRAMNNTELMKRANRERYSSLNETEDNRLCFIAAATMMVLEKELYISLASEGYGIFKSYGPNPDHDWIAIAVSPDLLTALLDALEADND